MSTKRKLGPPHEDEGKGEKLEACPGCGKTVWIDEHVPMCDHPEIVEYHLDHQFETDCKFLRCIGSHHNKNVLIESWNDRRTSAEDSKLIDKMLDDDEGEKNQKKKKVARLETPTNVVNPFDKTGEEKWPDGVVAKKGGRNLVYADDIADLKAALAEKDKRIEEVTQQRDELKGLLGNTKAVVEAVRKVEKCPLIWDGTMEKRQALRAALSAHDKEGK